MHAHGNLQHAALAGHTALTRALLQDNGVEVVSQGDAFYNEDLFPLLEFVPVMCAQSAFLHGPLSRGDVEDWARMAVGAMRTFRPRRIVIAATPAGVDAAFLRTLDGGILHEAFHTLYTTRGTALDVDRLWEILARHYREGFDYTPYRDTVHTLWNIYEDAYIERMGIEAFAGALPSLNRVHALVWDKERVGRMGLGWRLKDHVMSYLRDKVEDYLDGAPLEEYDARARALVDDKMADLILWGKTTRDSYDCFAVALATFHRLMDNYPEKRRQNKAGVPFDPGGNAPGGPAARGDAEEGDGKARPRVPEACKKDMEVAPAMHEPGSALSEESRRVMEKSRLQPRRPIPYAKALDKVVPVRPEDADPVGYAKLLAQVRRDTVAIRPKLVEYFRGLSKNRTRHNQREGRRLSPRTLAQAVYKSDPRPFMAKEVDACDGSAAVSILIDESGSMDKDFARYILVTLAATLAQIQVPFEVVGFQMGCEGFNVLWEATRPYRGSIDGKVDLHEAAKKSGLAQRVTRFHGVDYNVFRTFDEGFTPKSLAKLMATRAFNTTPLADGYDFVAQRIRARHESRRVVIVLTDGEPSVDDYTDFGHQDYFEMVGRMYQDLKAEGIETLFVGFGGTSAEGMERYPNSVYIDDQKNFAHLLTEHLYRAMRAK